MHRVLLFVEDFGHEAFIKALLQRMATESGVELNISSRSATGGRGRVLRELQQFVKEIERRPSELPDLMIVATDANCSKYAMRRDEVDQRLTESIKDLTVCAIPEPHIERWLLLDSAAFKAALGKGCETPPEKCERDLYKRLLIKAIKDAGLSPLIGGLEHTEDIVNNLDLNHLERADKSLGSLIKELKRRIKAWSQE